MGAPSFSQIQSAGAKFGLSDAELQKGLDGFSRWHQNKFGTGFNSTSSEAAIVNGAVQNALNARTDGNIYTNPAFLDYLQGAGPLNGALNYSASPERIAAHREDAITGLVNGQFGQEIGKKLRGEDRGFFGDYRVHSMYDWSADDIRRLAALAVDTSPQQVADQVNGYLSGIDNAGADSAWWGPQAVIQNFATQLGKTPDKYIDANTLAAQQKQIGDNWQQNEIRVGQEEDASQATLMSVLGAAGAGLGLAGAFSGLGAGAGALGEGALASTLAAEGSSGLLGAGLGSGAAGGAGLGSLGLESALSGAGTFEAGLGSTLGGNAGLGISGSLGSSAGGVLGGAGSFADIAAGGALGGIGGAAGIGALPSIAAEGAAIGGVGSSGAASDVVASGTGGGSSGGEMGDWDFLDLLDGGNSTVDAGAGDWDFLNDLTGGSGTNPYGGDLGLPNGTLPDGSVDVGASWQNQLQAALSGVPNLPPGVSTALKSLFGGGSAAGSNSLLGLLGKGLGGVLDYTASSKAADNAKEIADRTWGAGQQYRDNASRAMTPGFDLNSIPGYSGALSTGMDAFNRSLSAKNGNPWGQGGAAGEAISWAGKTIGLPAWQNYFNSNSNAGGLSNLATQSTTAGLNAGAADQATYGSLGQTARNIFDPQPNYQKQYLDLLGKQYGLA